VFIHIHVVKIELCLENQLATVILTIKKQLKAFADYSKYPNFAPQFIDEKIG
jgi:hypothetical protein